MVVVLSSSEAISSVNHALIESVGRQPARVASLLQAQCPVASGYEAANSFRSWSIAAIDLALALWLAKTFN